MKRLISFKEILQCHKSTLSLYKCDFRSLIDNNFATELFRDDFAILISIQNNFKLYPTKNSVKGAINLNF